jgi:hypothetical protein
MKTLGKSYLNVIILIFMLWPSVIWAQKTKSTKLDWDLKVINLYFKEFNPKTTHDSAFYSAYFYLNYSIENDTTNLNLAQFADFIRTNRPAQALKTYFQFYDTVRTRNQIYHNLIASVMEKKRIMAIADTAEIAITDSIFDDLSDAIQENINFDSILNIKPQYSDTLLSAIACNLSNLKQNPVFKLLKEFRHDTTCFYLVNLNGDSVRLRLFNNNPDLVHISISDLLGQGQKAIVRDIQHNSFRILLDQADAIQVASDKNAKQAIGGIYQRSQQKSLTIKKFNTPEPSNYWIYGGNVNTDITQIALSNWVKGGVNTYSALVGLELFATYKKKVHSWENSAKFRYGTIHQEGKKYFRPTEDKIEIISKYGYKAFSKFYYSTRFEFKSQFAPAHSYKNDSVTGTVSSFFSPAYLTIAVGLDYKPNENLSLFISPFTSKNTFVTNSEVKHSSYGVSDDKNLRSETGAILNITYKKKIWGNIETQNSLELFSNYISNPQNIDLDWNLKLVFPVNDFIRATISTELIYDDNQDIPVYDSNNTLIRYTKAVQFKELFTLGFAMKF